MGKFNRIIILSILILVLISFVYGVIGTITSFSNQDNPFNITFTVGENQIFPIDFPRYVYLLNLTILLKNNNLTVRQEFANVSTSYNPNTGAYNFTESGGSLWDNQHLAVDGNYSTFAAFNGNGISTLYINYTKPQNSTGATWQTDDHGSHGSFGSWFNITIPFDCFNYSDDKLVLKVELARVDTKHIFWNCFNGTPDWKLLRNYTDNTQRLYE